MASAVLRARLHYFCINGNLPTFQASILTPLPAVDEQFMSCSFWQMHFPWGSHHLVKWLKCKGPSLWPFAAQLFEWSSLKKALWFTVHHSTIFNLLFSVILIESDHSHVNCLTTDVLCLCLCCQD